MGRGSIWRSWKSGSEKDNHHNNDPDKDKSTSNLVDVGNGIGSNDQHLKETGLPSDSIAAQTPKTPRRTKSGYPFSVLFIVGNEFCERFSFYGMKAILPIYLTSWLGFSESTSTTIIHSFNFSAYFFSLFGAILSDNFLGKFNTILYLSIVYCIGNAVMALTALPGVTGTPPNWWGMALGLVLIGIGTGGIKPCVASFGGDQFKPDERERISKFFSAFYFAINAGSVLSMFITPLLRSKVHCFKQDSCYPLAFGVPAVLMLIALIVFVVGASLYRKEPARNNVVLMFFSLLGTASVRAFTHLFSGCCGSKRDKPPTNNEPITPRSATTTGNQCRWLYRAADKFDVSFINDASRVVRVFTVFIPVCIFWALYDQQGSWWVYQAVMMKSEQKLFGWSFSVLPEQMGLANAILILVLIPIFGKCVYPMLDRMGNFRALPRILTGMVLAMVAFFMAAVLQFIMYSRGTFAPSPSDPATQVCTSGCINIFWQLPQYFVITCAEVFLSITGLEFAYSQAPASMKSVCQAGWLLTVAGGNLIVILVTLIDPVNWFHPTRVMAWNFCLWTGIMGLGCLLFWLLSAGYEYREDEDPTLVMTDEDKREEEFLKASESQLSFKSDAPLAEQ